MENAREVLDITRAKTTGVPERDRPLVTVARVRWRGAGASATLVNFSFAGSQRFPWRNARLAASLRRRQALRCPSPMAALCSGDSVLALVFLIEILFAVDRGDGKSAARSLTRYSRPPSTTRSAMIPGSFLSRGLALHSPLRRTVFSSDHGRPKHQVYVQITAAKITTDGIITCALIN